MKRGLALILAFVLSAAGLPLEAEAAALPDSGLISENESEVTDNLSDDENAEVVSDESEISSEETENKPEDVITEKEEEASEPEENAPEAPPEETSGDGEAAEEVEDEGELPASEEEEEGSLETEEGASGEEAEAAEEEPEPLETEEGASGEKTEAAAGEPELPVEEEAETEEEQPDLPEKPSIEEMLGESETLTAAEAEEDIMVIAEEAEFDPFDWDAYTESPFALFSLDAYEGSYGSELSEEQKALYDALEDYYLDADGNFSNGTTDALTFTYPEEYTAESEEDYIDLKNELMLNIGYAYWAFVYDHPEVYWAGAVKMGLGGTQSGTTYKLTTAKFDISEKYSGAQSELEAYKAGVNAAVEKIRTSAASDGRQDILKSIHDWLCSTLSYNYDAISSANLDSDAYKYVYSNGAVFTGKYSVVCQGYAEAFKVLSDQFEIPCADIVGTASGTSHMWNYVQMEDGNWYAVDCTWDDQTAISYTYFLCGADSMGFHDTFSNEHVEKPCFSTNESIIFIYPSLSATAYANLATAECEHSEFEWRIVKEPDCITEGVRNKVCKICNQLIDTEKIPATKLFSDGCTLSIAQNSWIYTGNAVKPEITFLCNGQPVAPECYQVVYSNNISAGTGSVSVTGKNGYQGTLTASFTIRKADSSIRLAGISAVYNGNAVEIPEAGHYGSSGAVTYTYYTDAACTVKTSVSANGASSAGAAPRYAGTYYVKASLAADANYNGAVSSAAKLVIEKAAVSVSLSPKTVSYTGNPVTVDQANVLNGSGAVNYIYYTDSGCTKKTTKGGNGADAEGGAPRNAGTYYVKASVLEDNNHKAAVSSAVKLVIAKSTAVIKLKAKTAPYTGKAVSIDAATVTSGAGKVTYTYYTDKKCTKKTSKSKSGASGSGKAPKYIGTYYVKAKVAANENCYSAASSAVKLVITKGTPKVTLKEKTAAYTGKAISIGKASVTSGAGKITYTYYTDAKCTKKTSKSKNGASGSGKAPKYAGIYYVRASVASNSNYKSAKSSAVKLTIKPGRAALSSVKNTSGKKITVKWSGKTGAGTSSGIKYVIEYSTDKKFKSDVKQKTVSGNKKSCTISNLKKGKTYYVRIKAYSTVQKAYGKVSAAKKVKITK